MSKLKGVAIGAGYFSQFHFEAWSRIENAELTAICDLDLARAQDAANQYGVANAYDDFDKMLSVEKPDFVDIITRPDSHLAHVQQAVDSGVPIICQKPLAPTFEEAKQIVDIARNANVPLMVHENFRFQPWYREVKRLMNDDVIGDKLHSLQMRTRTGDGWQPDAYMGRQPYFREMERFLVFEMGVHFIDTFRYLAGEVNRVYASLRKLNQEIAGEDAATVLFEFANGGEGIWDANRYNETTATDPRYTFGEILAEGNRGSIRVYSDGRITVQKLGEPEQPHEYVHAKKNFASDCVFATQTHFVEQLRAGKPFETSGTEYLKTLTVQEAVYRSAKIKNPVEVGQSQPEA